MLGFTYPAGQGVRFSQVDPPLRLVLQAEALFAIATACDDGITVLAATFHPGVQTVHILVCDHLIGLFIHTLGLLQGCGADANQAQQYGRYDFPKSNLIPTESSWRSIQRKFAKH